MKLPGMAADNRIRVLTVFTVLSFAFSLDYDNKGYVMYCPCMGRFGNQADHFLGSLAFAKGLDRTLVLPPWVEYHTGKLRSVQVPFDTYFSVEALSKYHRVITMEKFMKEIAPTMWPPGDRAVLCHSARRGPKGDSCNAKDGNPFGPFWDTFDIDFDKSLFYSPLYFDVSHPTAREQWHSTYPPSAYPVLAFAGAPAAFPVSENNVKLHKYVVWSTYIDKQATDFINTHIKEGPFVGIHLRNGSDFKSACTHLSPTRHLFASPQCLGYNMQHGRMSDELCFPSERTVLRQLKSVIKKARARAVFVATDDETLLPKLHRLLKKQKVSVVHLDERKPHVDLAILARADHYIGNCASSFSAFAARERLVNSRGPTSFWGFKPSHDEL